MPVIGVLGIGSPESNAKQLASFRNGLSEQGFGEGQNAVIESRFAATGQYDGLLSLASDLVRLPVTVLVAIGTAGVARAAKMATTTIPIAFANGSDPVKVGLVASMNWKCRACRRRVLARSSRNCTALDWRVRRSGNG